MSVAKIAPSFSANVMLADFIRAQAGAPEAIFDATVSAIYSAYYHVLKSGNKTQFNLVEVAAKQYSDVKACKEALNSKTLTAGVKRFNAVYLAYGAALAVVGVPGVMKEATMQDGSPIAGEKATHADWDRAAGQLALEFATMVTVALTPETKTGKTEEEKASAKAEKEATAKAEEKAAAKALADTIKAEAEKIANASVVTLADMVRIVANAIKTGLLEKADLTALDQALDSVAANVEFVPVGETETEQMPA